MSHKEKIAEEGNTAPKNEGCVDLVIYLGIEYQERILESEAVCLTVDQDTELASLPIDPGWPPAKPPARGGEWPRVGRPHRGGHDKEDGN